MSVPYVADFKLDYVTLMTGLINSNNSTTFSVDQVSFSGLTTGSNGKNTKVTVAAVGSNPNQGTVDVHYNRIEMNDLNEEPLVIDWTEELTLQSDLLALVNVHYGTALTVADLVDVAVAEGEPGTDVTFDLAVRPDHGVFLSGCTIKLVYPELT